MAEPEVTSLQPASPCYADVLLPLAVGRLLCYQVPPAMVAQIRLGARVVVPLRKYSHLVGLVWALHHRAPTGYRVKCIEELVDQSPLITPCQQQLWEWMTHYYMCTLGEVMAAALPAGLKMEWSTFVQCPATQPDYLPTLSPSQRDLLRYIEQHGPTALRDLLALQAIPHCAHHLRALLSFGLLEVAEKVVNSYRPKRIRCLLFAPDYQAQDRLLAAVEALNRAPAQQRFLLGMLGHLMKCHGHLRAPVDRAELLERIGGDARVANALVDRGILQEREMEAIAFYEPQPSSATSPELSPSQQAAFQEILQGFAQRQPVLLHGVTGSGKTELYIRLIEQCRQRGEQALYLLPEIALTAQMVGRLRSVLGDQVVVYHSQQSDNARSEIYYRVLHFQPHGPDQRGSVVLGARSAVFLPFQKLGLIIVDEEHESSYKQQAPAPRYQGRDLALVLAKIHGAHVVLGSATPSLESYANAQRQRYHLVTLTQRYGQAKLPTVETIDMRQAKALDAVKGHFSQQLLEAIAEAIAHGNRVILFQNRRGYAPFMQCNDCAHVPTCPHCDVSLTYHSFSQQLICHYCGYQIPRPTRCPVCGSEHLSTYGLGTQRVEEELAGLLPEAKVARLDQDSTRAKQGAQRILDDFAQGRTNVLIGTQMVTKGLDFRNVQLVGILQADALLRMPDFRAQERAFQLMAQVGGRAGRSQVDGKVLIQTYDPESPVIAWVQRNDYAAFYHAMMQERRDNLFPPFVRLVRLTIRAKEEQLAHQAANALANVLRQLLGAQVLGPQPPYVARVKDFYLDELLIKLPRSGQQAAPLRDYIQRNIAHLTASPAYRRVAIQADVDPL